VTWEGAAVAVVVDVVAAEAAAEEEGEAAAAAAADGFISATKDLRIKSLVRNASSFLLFI
jgi:hypothetical protein